MKVPKYFELLPEIIRTLGEAQSNTVTANCYNNLSCNLIKLKIH